MSSRGKFGWAACLCLSLLGCASVEEQVREKIEYIAPAQEAQPGDIVNFSLKLPPKVTAARILFLEHVYVPFVRRDLKEPLMTAFMAVPWETPSGDYAITATFQLEGSRRELKETFPFLIVPLALEDAPQSVKCRTFDPAAWEKEQRELRAVLTRAEYQPERRQDFILPLAGEIRAVYGTQRRYNGKDTLTLAGLEIEPLAHGNTWDVMAAAKGKVLLAGFFPMLGNVVLIDHGFSFASLYAHLHSLKVKTGQVVVRGTKLGRAGHTGGAAVGNRLWFQIFVAGIPVNVKKALESIH